MKIFLRQCIFISLLFFAFNSSAQIQQVKFIPVSGTNGVSLGKINAIARDKYGFIWFSDQSNRCIIRFDGSHMTRYQNDPRDSNSLGGYYPECLFADTNGNIWIGFYGMGFDKFDPVTNIFTHYRHQKNDPESLSNDFVTAIVVDHLGKIWIGDYGGLDLLDEKTGKFKHYSNKPNDPSSLSCNKIRAVYEDKAGDLWVGTGFAYDDVDEGGLNRFNRSTGTFTRYMNDPKNPQTLINNKVRAIFEDSYGNFWVGTKGDGLHTMDRKTGLFTRHTYNPAKPDQLSRTPLKDVSGHISFITEDADKKIWIGTVDNGISRYDPVSKKMANYGNSTDKTGALKDSTSWCANATPDGIVWLSTQNANLFKIDIYNTVIPHFDSKDSNAIIYLAEAPDSVRWYGAFRGLLRKDLRNGTTRRFVNEPGNPNSLSNNNVINLIKDKEGNLWIGTVSGLNFLNLKTGNVTRYYRDTVNKRALSNIVYNLCEDSDSNIWVGAAGQSGLSMLNRKSGKFIDFKNDPANSNTISNDYVSAIVEGDRKDLWIGTYNNGGLIKLNRVTGKFTHYLPGLMINCIYKDADGIIWIGTPSGLFRYDKKSDSFNSSAEENAGNNIVQILSIVSDKEDNLWIACATGIYMLNKKRNQLIHFGKDYGIRDADNFFNTGAAAASPDGELFFGDKDGYYAFYPDKLKTASGNTPIYFTKFWLDNKEIISGKTGPLPEPLNTAKEIRLAHDQNVFSFSATFIDFRNASGKQIFYKLENYDNDWRSSGAEDRIQYFKVPSGKYILRIRTANTGNGEWIEKSIDIIISPPWWATWWAYTIYGLLFVAAAFSIHRYQRNRLIKAERERTRAKELAQAKEIEKAYHELKVTQAQLIQSEKMASLGELTAGIAHEIQNPLNFVNNFSEVNKELIGELREEKDDPRARDKILNDIEQNLDKVIHHGKRADAIVKGMLQHSRSGTGVKEPVNINAIADECLRLSYHGFRAKEKSFHANIQTHFDESIEKIPLIQQDIVRVLVNLFNNAFYAVSEKKKASISSAQQPYEPTVSVSTKKSGNQVSITVSDNGDGISKNIVDKIFQPFFTTKPTGQGTGLGLSLSYDIIKAHGGEIKVETKEGEGSEFIIQIPIQIN